MDGVMLTDFVMRKRRGFWGAGGNSAVTHGEPDITMPQCRRFSCLLAALALLLQPLAASAADWIYTVVDGDNLWDFSEKYLDSPVRFEKIRMLNNIEFPKRLQPGSRLRVPMKWIRSNPVPARVVAVEGRAEIVRADGSAPGSVAPGTLLQLGDTLKTDADSSAAIEFADGSLLTLYSAGEMRFDHLTAHGETGMVDSRLHLIEGRLDTRVKPAVGPGSRFEIQTPSAISAVRGTEYRAAVSGSDQTSNVEVLEGKVRVAGARKGRLIAQGFGTQVAAGKPPIPPRKLLPPPALDPVPPRIFELNWPLSWQPIGQARDYRVEISAVDNLDVLAWEEVVERTKVRLPDLPDGDYRVRIRGIDEIGLEGESTLHSLILDRHPQPPVSLQPADGQVVRGSPVELRWTDSADAAHYRLQIARDLGFEDIIVDRTGLDTTRFDTAEIVEIGAYHWRVTSIAADGEVGPPGAGRSWQIKPVPEAVDTSLAATDDAIIASWRQDHPEQTYQVQVALDPAFETLELERSTAEPRIGLDPKSGQVRYLRVRAIEPDGYQGPWGAVQRIDPPPDATRWFVPVLGVLGILLL
jgi:hypothetical protein